MARYLDSEVLARVDRLRPIADELGVSMAQLALSWCLRESNISSVIIGATRLEQLDDNAKCTGIEIPPEALAMIDKLFPGRGDGG